MLVEQIIGVFLLLCVFAVIAYNMHLRHKERIKEMEIEQLEIEAQKKYEENSDV